MKKRAICCFLFLVPILVLGQERAVDTTPEIGSYFINKINEIDYNRDLLDTIPGFHIAMIPPEHFVFAENIPGFIHPGTTASIQIKEIEGTSWPVIDKVMTPEHFEKQGVKFLERQEVNLQSGLSGVIYFIEFKAKGVPFERIMLFAGDYNNTIWINANYPKLLKKTIIKPIINSLMSAELI